MTISLVGNIFCPGRYNNYLIGGNICNAFALGDFGSEDNFFLIGAEPPDESNYPLLTGNVLDSEGKLLFRLVKNLLVLNPGHCSKILGDHIGYEIYDGNNHLIFKVKTRFEKISGMKEKSFVTFITANFYDNKGNLVFKANSGENDEFLQSNVKSIFGYSGGFGLVQWMEKHEMDIARAMLETKGSVHRVLTGQISNQKIFLDGSAIANAQISKCSVYVSTGDFCILGQNNRIEDCKFFLSGAAENIRWLVSQVHGA